MSLEQNLLASPSVSPLFCSLRLSYNVHSGSSLAFSIARSFSSPPKHSHVVSIALRLWLILSPSLLGIGGRRRSTPEVAAGSGLASGAAPDHEAFELKSVKEKEMEKITA